jgi:hypothetical protein
MGHDVAIAKRSQLIYQQGLMQEIKRDLNALSRIERRVPGRDRIDQTIS